MLFMEQRAVAAETAPIALSLGLNGEECAGFVYFQQTWRFLSISVCGLVLLSAVEIHLHLLYLPEDISAHNDHTISIMDNDISITS